MPGDIAISGVRILLIDDDPEFCSLLNDYLELNSISLTCAHDGQSGLDILDRRAFDLILLDMFLPDINGLDVLRRIRRMQSPPVVMLSAHNEETDRIIALEIGADDYVPKAFSSRELLARIRAVLRRCAPEQESAPPEKTDGRDILRVRDLTVNNHTKEAFLHGEPLNLTVSEFQILFTLISEPGSVFSREDLLRITAERDFNKYVSAQTTWEILEKAPWVFTVGGPRIIMIPATRHSELRRWLWAHGFAFVADRPVQAAGRWYAVMAAEYTGERHEPTFPECLLGGTGSWPEGAGYAAWQKAKLPRMRLGVPDGTPLADEIDRLLKEGTGL